MPTQNARKAKEAARARLSANTLIFRALLAFCILGMMAILSQPQISQSLGHSLNARLSARSGLDTHGGLTRGDAELADLFTPEVLYWREDILRWAKERSLNPNLIATIIQIESCGHPYVSSGAGAQGLFQVMPFHFSKGENQLNLENNARRGIDHLWDCLIWTNYDVGVSFACYNGGPSVIGLPPSQWFAESQSYYRWGTGIYNEASQGLESSPTLQAWLAAGGSVLCERARATQETLLPKLPTNIQ
jgi:soluble lytic murein transglycosylase-like protein